MRYKPESHSQIALIRYSEQTVLGRLSGVLLVVFCGDAPMKLMIAPRLAETAVAHEPENPRLRCASLLDLAAAAGIADPAAATRPRGDGLIVGTTDQADRLVFCSFPYQREAEGCGFAGIAAIGCVCAVHDWEPEESIDALDELIGLHCCQERLTAALADALEARLRPAGVGVILRRSPALSWISPAAAADTTLITMKLKGVLHDSPELRREFLRLARHGFERYEAVPAISGSSR